MSTTLISWSSSNRYLFHGSQILYYTWKDTSNMHLWAPTQKNAIILIYKEKANLVNGDSKNFAKTKLPINFFLNDQFWLVRFFKWKINVGVHVVWKIKIDHTDLSKILNIRSRYFGYRYSRYLNFLVCPYPSPYFKINFCSELV